MVAGWDKGTSTAFYRPPNDYPQPPFNGEVVSPLQEGMLDIRWDNPALLAGNTLWNVLGVNVYRSDNGELGPYHRLNSFPVASGFFRDITDNTLIQNEVVRWEQWDFRGDGPNDRAWQFRTQLPIVKNLKGCVFGNSPNDVIVTIDGVVVPVHSVFGRTGEIRLVNQSLVNPVTETPEGRIFPNSNSTVLVTYRSSRNFVASGMDQKLFYRLTTVALDENAQMFENPLDFSQPLTKYKVESMDWIWREAVRRNNWILEQGGERVKVFIKKQSGYPCFCGRDERTMEYSKQPDSRCVYCFGTGFLGGYEGPHEIIIAPDDAERSVTQTRTGRHLSHIYEVWTGPTPLLTQRDFIVKQTNERYSIGPVRKPSNRGNILQQHFQIGYLDENDLRYKVPVNGLVQLPWPDTRLTIDPRECDLVYPLAEYGPMTPLDPCEHGPQIYPVIPSHDPSQVVGTHSATPMATEKGNIADHREHRGRSQTWENHNYLWLLVPFGFWLMRLVGGMNEILGSM